MTKEYTNKQYIIIGEGKKSEDKYLQDLNRYLLEEYSIYTKTFVYIPVGTGLITEIKKVYKKIKKENPRSAIEIWVDYDIYKRNEQGVLEKYKKNVEEGRIPEFKFNYFNFEDFLIMHFDSNTLSKWETICKANNHFDTPMKSIVYLKLIRANLFKDYDKNSLTHEFNIDKNSLENLFRNNSKQSDIKSDFATFLERVLKPIL